MLSVQRSAFSTEVGVGECRDIGCWLGLVDVYPFAFSAALSVFVPVLAIAAADAEWSTLLLFTTIAAFESRTERYIWPGGFACLADLVRACAVYAFRLGHELKLTLWSMGHAMATCPGLASSKAAFCFLYLYVNTAPAYRGGRGRGKGKDGNMVHYYVHGGRLQRCDVASAAAAAVQHGKATAAANHTREAGLSALEGGGSLPHRSLHEPAQTSGAISAPS